MRARPAWRRVVTPGSPAAAIYRHRISVQAPSSAISPAAELWSLCDWKGPDAVAPGPPTAFRSLLFQSTIARCGVAGPASRSIDSPRACRGQAPASLRGPSKVSIADV